jgi:hypothetical protein
MDYRGGARGRFVLVIGKLLAPCNRHRDQLAEFLQVMTKDCSSVFPVGDMPKRMTVPGRGPKIKKGMDVIPETDRLVPEERKVSPRVY